jgi:hypothetical protein
MLELCKQCGPLGDRVRKTPRCSRRTRRTGKLRKRSHVFRIAAGGSVLHRERHPWPLVGRRHDGERFSVSERVEMARLAVPGGNACAHPLELSGRAHCRDSARPPDRRRAHRTAVPLEIARWLELGLWRAVTWPVGRTVDQGGRANGLAPRLPSWLPGDAALVVSGAPDGDDRS